MIKKIAAALALVAASSAAFAAEPPSAYAGIDVSSTKIDDSDNEGGYGAFFGYKFNENIAVEAGYHRLADTDVRIGAVRGDLTLDQIDVSVLGTLPLSNGFDVYARLGYNRLEAKADVAGYTGKEHDSGALYGLGLGYSFSPIVHARLEVQKPASDTTRIAAGVSYRF
jgi:OOP family OmpA-OmpF porin